MNVDVAIALYHTSSYNTGRRSVVRVLDVKTGKIYSAELKGRTSPVATIGKFLARIDGDG